MHERTGWRGCDVLLLILILLLILFLIVILILILLLSQVPAVISQAPAVIFTLQCKIDSSLAKRRWRSSMILMSPPRFPNKTLEWDPAQLKVTNVSEANAFVRRRYRKGWEVDGL